MTMLFWTNIAHTGLRVLLVCLCFVVLFPLLRWFFCRLVYDAVIIWSRTKQRLRAEQGTGKKGENDENG